MKTDLAYRYANAESFFKMIESQELWFTDLRNMNDWDEYSAGFRIAHDLIMSEFPDYASVLENISREKMHDYFMMLICSFSHDGDCRAVMGITEEALRSATVQSTYRMVIWRKGI